MAGGFHPKQTWQTIFPAVAYPSGILPRKRKLFSSAAGQASAEQAPAASRATVAQRACPRVTKPVTVGVLPRRPGSRRVAIAPPAREREKTLPHPGASRRSPETKRRQSQAESRAERYKDVGVVPGLTLVETLTVSAPVRKQYTRLVCSLMSFITGWTADPTPKVPPLTLAQSLTELDALDSADVDDEVVEWADAALRTGVEGHHG